MNVGPETSCPDSVFLGPSVQTLWGGLLCKTVLPYVSHLCWEG
jgi:hypothetical protein